MSGSANPPRRRMQLALAGSALLVVVAGVVFYYASVAMRNRTTAADGLTVTIVGEACDPHRIQRAVTHLPAGKGDLARKRQRCRTPCVTRRSAAVAGDLVIVEARHLLRYPSVHSIAVVAAIDLVDSVCDTRAGRSIQ